MWNSNDDLELNPVNIFIVIFYLIVYLEVNSTNIFIQH